MTVAPMHCEAHKMAIATIGAVLRLIGMCNRGKPILRRGIETGTITKNMEKMKRTRVAIADPVTIRIDHQLWAKTVVNNI
jgi:hypothetical protein